ncbi:hypothetical protein [Clostridium acidisoli]|jgi:hypothetical protein|nr:hypothetical protein [Clostridium acidisoli]
MKYRRKNSISIKSFIEEFGEEFSEHVKEKLMELDSRTFLTRKEFENRLDIKHVEHLKYDCSNGLANSGTAKQMKEYSYGELEVVEGALYLSEKSFESKEFVEAPGIDDIYSALGSEEMIEDNGKQLKKLDENNIDYVVDTILSICPEVSQKYIDIVKGMVERSNNR